MSDRRALVTGASSGLGRYLATRLADRGWTVTGVGRGPGGEPGFDHVQADLSRWDALPELADRVGGTPDLVVHCAVAYPHHEPGSRTPEELEEVFRVNALAPYLLTQRLLADKPADRFCACVMVNSEVVYGADANSATYAASKAALRVLTTGLADSARENASVSTLLLGPLDSEDKRASVRTLAARQGLSEDEITRRFLRRSNPNLVIDTFIGYDACLRSVEYLFELGPIANGMVCRLDGGSSGSLV